MEIVIYLEDIMLFEGESMDRISFSCNWCQKTNWVEEVDNKLCSCVEPIRCSYCHKVSFPHAIFKFDEPGRENENWLQCITYEGELAGSPVGTVTVDGVTQYIAADGRMMTRGDFIAEFHTDPAKHIIDRIRMHQRFQNGRDRRF